MVSLGFTTYMLFIKIGQAILEKKILFFLFASINYPQKKEIERMALLGPDTDTNFKLLFSISKIRGR